MEERRKAKKKEGGGNKGNYNKGNGEIREEEGGGKEKKERRGAKERESKRNVKGYKMTRADNRKGQGVCYRERREEQWETRRRQRGRKNTIERKQSRILERQIRGREEGEYIIESRRGGREKKL